MFSWINKKNIYNFTTEKSALTRAGFIQARLSQIQGLFKDFSRTNLIVFKDYDTYTNS